MENYIHRQNSELCWTTYTYNWGENDFNCWLDWLKQGSEGAEGAWKKYHTSIYAVVKDLTWEQVYVAFKQYTKTGNSGIKIDVMHLNGHISRTDLGELLDEVINQDTWDGGEVETGDNLDTDTETTFSDENL